MNNTRKKLISDAFNKLDKTGDGIVDITDLESVYDVSCHKKFKNGEWTKEQCLTEFINSFEGGKEVPASQKDGKVLFII